MADITWDNVEAFAPELSSVDSDAQTDILAYVNDALNVSAFGGESSPFLKLARICLAAHFGSISGLGASGASGPVVRKRLGQAEIEYASGGSYSMTTLGMTTYGQTYLSLVNQTGYMLDVI